MFRVGVEATEQRILQEGMRRETMAKHETKALPTVDAGVEATLRVSEGDSVLAITSHNPPLFHFHIAKSVLREAL
jgi:hypothetical protein